MGSSASTPLRAETARMSDWGMLDMPAALDWLLAPLPAAAAASRSGTASAAS